MALRGRPPGSGRAPQRKPVYIYALPRTQLLIRLLAENHRTTIGQFVDDLVAAEAERHGINLGSAA